MLGIGINKANFLTPNCPIFVIEIYIFKAFYLIFSAEMQGTNAFRDDSDSDSESEIDSDSDEYIDAEETIEPQP